MNIGRKRIKFADDAAANDAGPSPPCARSWYDSGSGVASELSLNDPPLSTSGSYDGDAVSPSPTCDAWVDCHEIWAWTWYPEVPSPGIHIWSVTSSRRLVHGALFIAHLITTTTISTAPLFGSFIPLLMLAGFVIGR
ncbi:hypothetical protein GEV33_002536 [Tenebrio molitor]|uniref:Uncharacterized protein n=1 Tax=Tenebrio molitor TaxID=7067 RepID=A0A8J6HK70_TENMO|nr:hypothetical protein GEV33_002536 [Tenebrio molitor]